VRDLDLEARDGIEALFETIVEHVPAPKGDPDAPFLMQVSTLGWRDHIGRTGTGKVLQGRLRVGEDIARTTTRWKTPEWLGDHATARREDWEVTGTTPERTTYLWVTRGLESVPVEEVAAGDIVTIAGPKEISIAIHCHFPNWWSRRCRRWRSKNRRFRCCSW